MLSLSEAAVDERDKEKDHEDQDKLAPLRLTPSKSAPVMTAISHEGPERPAAELRDSKSAVHKSASATPLLLLVKTPPPIRTEGLCHYNVATRLI